MNPDCYAPPPVILFIMVNDLSFRGLGIGNGATHSSSPHWKPTFHETARVFFIAVCNSALSVAATFDYGRDIQPILSGHCTHCHGADEKSRKGGLRLDVRRGGDALPQAASVKRK